MKNTNKKQKIDKAINAVINEYRKGSSQNDPLGMYTGITVEESVNPKPGTQNSIYNSLVKKEEQPTQDADDL